MLCTLSNFAGEGTQEVGARTPMSAGVGWFLFKFTGWNVRLPIPTAETNIQVMTAAMTPAVIK